MASSHLPPPAPAFDPPPSDADLYSQVDDIEEGPGRWHEITGQGFTVRARKPAPTALKALGAATSSSVSKQMQSDMVTVFVQHHLHPADWEMLLVWMMDPAVDFDMKSLGEVMRRIATLGTARPTGRSSRSRRRLWCIGGRSARS